MATEKRLIDVNDVYSLFTRNGTAKFHVADIDLIPRVDAVEVVHGQWEKHGEHDWRCSVCKVGVPYSFTGHNYCHNCSAKMGGGENDGCKD